MCYIHKDTTRIQMPCFLDFGNTKYICSTVNKNQMYPSFIPRTTKVVYVQQPPMSDIELYFAYFSLCILFPLLYNMLVCGNNSAVMVLWRYITSGVFDTVAHIKEFATDMFYATLRMFGQYTFSTYTVVKDGREIFTSSSMYYYYKSDINTVYRIDRAKYNVCKWIDKQCKMFQKIHGEEPEVNETRNEIYDFILHKVDNQPYTRIHRGNFTGRTHTLITEHYRPCRNSYQFASDVELTVYGNTTTVEPPMVSSETTNTNTNTNSIDDDTDTCFKPYVFKINLKTPHHYFLEKNEILDTSFLKWVVYNECGRPEIAKYLRSLFYNYKVTMYYNECMKEYFNNESTAIHSAIAAADTSTSADTTTQAPNVVNMQETRLTALTLNESQSVVIGHTYVVKVDSVLRCPIFESNEKQVFDIDGVLSTYYDCSDSESENESDHGSDSESDHGSDSDSENENDNESEIATQNKHQTNDATEKSTPDGDDPDPEFEVIQEDS